MESLNNKDTTSVIPKPKGSPTLHVHMVAIGLLSPLSTVVISPASTSVEEREVGSKLNTPWASSLARMVTQTGERDKQIRIKKGRWIE